MCKYHGCQYVVLQGVGENICTEDTAPPDCGFEGVREHICMHDFQAWVMFLNVIVVVLQMRGVPECEICANGLHVTCGNCQGHARWTGIGLPSPTLQHVLWIFLFHFLQEGRMLPARWTSCGFGMDLHDVFLALVIMKFVVFMRSCVVRRCSMESLTL